MSHEEPAGPIFNIGKQWGNTNYVQGDLTITGDQVFPVDPNSFTHRHAFLQKRLMLWRTAGIFAALILSICIGLIVTSFSGVSQVPGQGPRVASSSINWPEWIGAITSVATLALSVQQTHVSRRGRGLTMPTNVEGDAK